MPQRYLRIEAGRWRCPPGERVAERFGLYCRLRSSAEIDWVLQRNLRFLEDYLAIETSPVTDQAADVILKLVEEQTGLHLDALVGQLTNASVVDDDIYALIACNRIYVDLQHGFARRAAASSGLSGCGHRSGIRPGSDQEPTAGRLRGEARGTLAHEKITLTRRHLDRQALPTRTLLNLASEIAEGEAALRDEPRGRKQLGSLFGAARNFRSKPKGREANRIAASTQGGGRQRRRTGR